MILRATVSHLPRDSNFDAFSMLSFVALAGACAPSWQLGLAHCSTTPICSNEPARSFRDLRAG